MFFSLSYHWLLCYMWDPPGTQSPHGPWKFILAADSSGNVNIWCFFQCMRFFYAPELYPFRVMMVQKLMQRIMMVNSYWVFSEHLSWGKSLLQRTRCLLASQRTEEVALSEIYVQDTKAQRAPSSVESRCRALSSCPCQTRRIQQLRRN